METIFCNGHLIIPGVVAGSQHGHYVSKYVVETALELGWVDDEARLAVESYDAEYHSPDWPWFDMWFDIVDEAELWLNEHTVHGIWHIADGDFRVDAIEDCPRCGFWRFADPDVRGQYDPCGEHLFWG